MRQFIPTWLALAALTISGGAFQKTGDPAGLLPGEGEVPGWRADGAPRRFIGDELFDYIDGGAEIFREFGFRSVITGDYLSSSGRKIVLEVFEMENDEAAFGMFTYFQVPEGRDLAVGDSAQLAEYYLSMWKGRFLANLTADRDEPGTDQALADLASALARRIPGRGKPPRLVSLFPRQGLVPRSVDYFEGSLGFLNSAPVFRTDVFGSRRGARAEYAGGGLLLLIEFDSPRECQGRFNRAASTLKATEEFGKNGKPAGRTIRFYPSEDREAVAFIVGRFIVCGVAPAERPFRETALAATMEEAGSTLTSEDRAEQGIRIAGAWKIGFSERARFTTWDNAETLDEARNMGTAGIFFRSRLTLQGSLRPGLELEFGLANESTQWVVPSGRAFEPDEVIVDRLLLRWSRPGGIPLVLSFGRQDLLMDDGFLVAEGTPLDETRTAYFNALKIDWNVSGRTSISFLACHQPEQDEYLPRFNGRRRALIEQPVSALGVFGRWTGERLEAGASALYLSASGGSRSLPEMSVLGLGARAAWRPHSWLRFSGEFALQLGESGGDALLAWSGDAGLEFDGEDAFRIPVRAAAGALCLSGDNSSSERLEGWMPFFGRSPRWSEAYIFTLAPENEGKLAWWSNLASVFVRADYRLTGGLSLKLGIHRLMAFQSDSSGWAMVSGDGHDRGWLWTAGLEFRMSKNLGGLFVFEGFRPGSYYIPGADGFSFLRFELTWSL